MSEEAVKEAIEHIIVKYGYQVVLTKL